MLFSAGAAKSPGAQIRSRPNLKLLESRCRGDRSLAASCSSPLFFPFPWGAAGGSGAQPLAMGSPPNREGLRPRRPSPPVQSPPRWVFFTAPFPSPTPGFSEARPASLAELPPQVPSAPGASLCSDSYGLRRVPLASGAFAPIAGRPVAHGRVHLQVTFCKRPAQPGLACPLPAS